jgi:S1-C subfamily serine protease
MHRTTLASAGRALALLIAAAAAPGTSIMAGALPADKFFARTAPSVWRVLSYDADGIAFAQGSAVVIAKETLLTNCHVLAKAKRFVIKQDNVSYEARLQHIDTERDLCQITARNLSAPPVPLGDSDKLTVGQRVYALGNPENLELTLSEGLISSLRHDEEGGLKLIQTSAPISHGSSGGGLFDDEGRLIGITTLQSRTGQNLNFAMPINYLRELPARSAAALARRATAKTSASAAPARTEQPAARADADKPLNRPAPQASGYADINDVAKLAELRPNARAAYEEFLTRPLPRAFALAEGRGWWVSWGTRPKNTEANPDPALRIIPDCEKYHQRRCTIYAIDNVVVYKPEPKAAAQN